MFRFRFCLKLLFFYKSISLEHVDDQADILCSTFMTHLDDLKAKVTDLEKLCESFYKSIYFEYIDISG